MNLYKKLIIASFFALASAASAATLTITSPAAAAGSYLAGTANFGEPLTPQIAAGIAVPITGAAGWNACSPTTPQQALEAANKIVAVDDGGCDAVTKARAVQALGGVAVVIMDTTGSSTPPSVIGVAPDVTIGVATVTTATRDVLLTNGSKRTRTRDWGGTGSLSDDLGFRLMRVSAAPAYAAHQIVFYDPTGQQGTATPPGTLRDRATIQAVDSSTFPATYTITVMHPRPGGAGFVIQKPDLVGVAESSLYLGSGSTHD